MLCHYLMTAQIFSNKVANTAGLFNRRIDFTVDSTGLWPTLQNIKGSAQVKICSGSEH